MFRMMLGRIHELDGHFVGTEFFAFVGPLIPLRSMYVTNEQFERRGNVSIHRWQGVDVPLHPGSIVLGYLRVWLPILAFAMPFILMWGEPVELDRQEYLVSVALFVAWIFLLVVPGRLSRRAKEEATILRAVTGIGLAPKRLDRFELETRTDRLAERLAAEGVSATDPKDARAALDAAPRDVRALLFVYARYASRGEPAWSEVATAALDTLR